MKPIIPFLFFFVFSVANSQNYQPLLEENRSWSTVDEYYHLNFGGANRSHHYYLNGDTIIESISFFRIYKIDDYYSTDNMVGFVREDTLKRVYFRDLQENEGLIYDFNVNINDTIEYTYMGIHSIMAVVTGISEFDGTDPPRRSIELQEIEGTTTETWIEGIGSSQGLLESGAEISGLVGADFELLCHHEDDSLIYLNPRFSGCSWPLNVGINPLEGQKQEHEPVIYPNPAKERIWINSQSSFPLKIEIIDLNGQIVFTESIHNNNQLIILNENLQGLYIYRISDNNKITTGKLLILIDR